MGDNRLVVVWSSGDPEVAHNTCFMYTRNAKKQGWFDDVTLIIWGPSAPLLVKDESLRKEIKAMTNVGVRVMACQKCAENYGVHGQLVDMGIESVYIGEILSNMIKEGRYVLTF